MVISAKPPRRRTGRIFLLAAVAVGLGLFLVPLLRKEPFTGRLSFLNRFQVGEVQAEEQAPEENKVADGKVRVFVSGRAIPAYSKLTRDDLWNAGQNNWASIDVDESVVEAGGIFVNASDIVGRVMGREKAPGYAFTESDFLPKGTRPGVAGGVPAGKRALRISVDKVGGIVGLQAGDRFDMVAATELEPKQKPQLIPLAGLHAQRFQQGATKQPYPRARVRVLIQNGVVVTPLHTRLVPISSTSLTQGQTTRTKPVQEMVVALDPEEVAPFLEAQTIGSDLTCLARSGRPDDPLDSVTPSSDPLGDSGSGSLADPLALFGGTRSEDGEMRVVESIQNGERVLVPVPVHPSEQEDPE